MREFADAMNAPTPDMVDISRRRIAFSQLFRQHMQQEDAFVQTLRTLGRPKHVDDVLRTHGDAMRDLFLQYSAHIKIWTPDRIAREWAGYRKDVLGLQRQLSDRMAWEEKTLYPLAPYANNNIRTDIGATTARRQAL